MPRYKIELWWEDLVFFLNSELNWAVLICFPFFWTLYCLHMCYMTQQLILLNILLRAKGGGRLLPPSLMLSPFTIRKIDSVKLNIRDFPSKFSCSIFFFLLVYCFYALRPLQIVFVASCCGAGSRDIRSFEWGRVWGIAPCFPSCQSLPYKWKF